MMGQLYFSAMLANPTPPTACQYTMHDGKACGRPLHGVTDDADSGPACLMHSHDPQKSWEEFWKEVQAILKQTHAVHDFSGFVFTRDAVFANVVFAQAAHFHGSHFRQTANFRLARFTAGVSFLGAKFNGHANFVLAKFTGNAMFALAKFSQEAYFLKTDFIGDTDFDLAELTGDANFSLANFKQTLSFGSSELGGIADFIGTTFEQPAQVRFYRVNQRMKGLRARLRSCPVSGVRFEDVHWMERAGRLLLQDEIDLIARDERVTHELVADAYRRLVNNFEKSRQFELAEGCIVGEMEMRRRNPRNFLFGARPIAERFYRKHAWARWLGEQFSVLNAYRWVSNYGSSYLRAFKRISVFSLLIFPFLFGLFAVHRADLLAIDGANTPLISWGNAWTSPDRFNQLWRTYETMLRTTMQMATLQRNPYAVPATASGQWVQLAMVLTLPGLLALFLFALRRRFRR